MAYDNQLSTSSQLQMKCAKGLWASTHSLKFLAYRKLAWWGWGYLGQHRRVVLPSCVVARIRNEFPSDDYTDHQFPPPTP